MPEHSLRIFNSPASTQDINRGRMPQAMGCKMFVGKPNVFHASFGKLNDAGMVYQEWYIASSEHFKLRAKDSSDWTKKDFTKKHFIKVLS